MSFAPGDRVDRYIIEDLLGEGGMARVYRARDQRLSRRVALKVLRTDAVADPNAAASTHARAMREARAAAALDHPNATAIFDVGEAEGEIFIAMELVVGRSLRDYVGDATVAWDIKLRWMLDAARALGAAHQRGLVHRDVKPENVMVRRDGVVKVLDFGIAKRVAVDTQGWGTLDDLRTIQGAIVGTPFYLSPEQIRGDPVDGRADQFAWAVTAYELLTGGLPWRKDADGFQLVLSILDYVPVPPSGHVHTLPAAVDTAIMKSLAKSPPDRFDSMESVIAALEGLVSTLRHGSADGPSGVHATVPSPAAIALVHTQESPGRASGPPGAPATPAHLRQEAGTEARSHTPAGPSSPIVAPAGTATRTSAGGEAEVPRRARAPMLHRPASVAAGAIVLASVIALATSRFALHKSSRPGAAATPSTDRAAAPRPTAVSDLPAPRSSVPQAVAAFGVYTQSFRDGDWNAAMKALEGAIARDPTMGAAYLRLAFFRSLESIDEGRVRSTFRRAVQHRGTLDERDAALLGALEPYLQADPSDPGECERSLVKLRERYPLDGEIAYILGSVRYDRGEVEAALDAFDAAIAIDPRFAQAWSTKAGSLAYLGRFDEALNAIEQAERASPAATEPLWYRAQIDEQNGRCADEEADVRKWLSRNPDDWYAYQYFARALAGESKPLETIRTALEEKWVRLDPDRREERSEIDRALLDMLSGDFASAEGHIGRAEALLAPDPGAQAHAEAMTLLLRVDEETGRLDRARDVAKAFLARKEAWAPPHRVDDLSIRMDPVPEMLSVLARTGTITPAEQASRRDAWARAWRAKTGPAYVGLIWIAGWAGVATNAEEANAALSVLAQFGELPPFAPSYPSRADVGHVYLLAGRTRDAIDALRRGTASCTQLIEPVAHVHASFELGVALEQIGDRAGACAAYGAVLKRWGAAKPRSITADKARTRVAALGCR